VGGRTYLSPRKPARVPAQECRIRGGEYVEFDRADLQTALKVWMEAATKGDAEAQVTVGEIYERGLGAEPNYAAAALWYQKAADQGYARGLFNLGTLYELGRGVEVDRLKALNLYRQAWGIPSDNIIYERAATEQIDQLRTELERQIAERDEQIKALAEQVEQAKTSANSALTKQNAVLERLLADLRAQRSGDEKRLSAIPPSRTREPTSTANGVAALDRNAYERVVRGLKFGRYYAIVIGNQKYREIESLQTPRADAERAGKVLRDKYGFSVQVLEDVDDVAMMKAFNDLAKVATENDNVLIYYAGHGARLNSAGREVGYWLPTNAARPPDDTLWVINDQISAHLGRLPAKRVLVVADSCYAGLLSVDPGVNLFGREASLEYFKYKLPKRSRLLIASGGDKPVLDEGGGGNSVFARAFLDTLESNQGILTAPALFERLQGRVKAAAAQKSFSQVPELRSIKSAGHELGDFFFVPKGS
jgi:uncharacterized protein